MRNLAIDPRRSLLAGAVLALPGVLLLSIAWLEIEPFNDTLRTVNQGVVIASLVLLPVAIVLLVWPILRRRGIRHAAPNLVAAGLLLLLMAPLLYGIGEELINCELRRVPNCD